MNREEARKRAQALVEQMTLEERAGQLRYDAPAIPRLHIPAYNWWNEGIHGVARAGTATVFPQAIGMAASFDEELIGEMADCVATEGRAKYNALSGREDRDIYKGLTFWAPNVNIFRDPRWGRGHETYGEDPYLTSRLGVAYVKGLQGEGDTMKAAACAKHYAVHSGPEALRHEFNAKASPKDMEETYLPAFEALVKEAGVEAVMGAYNRVNGEPCCGSPTLIRETLREKWGFQGHFVSDCWAIRDFHERHMVTTSAQESAAMALNAGCDLNCGNTYLHLLHAYQSGLVSEEAITESAVRLFTTRFLLGLFDGSEYDKIPYDVVDCEEHRMLAERAAAESMVLLKNDGMLPLNIEEIHTIGVIGPNADSRRALIGNYHGTSSEYITVLEGIRRLTEGKARVLYSEGCQLAEERTEALAQLDDRLAEAAVVAENSDVVVLCLGLDETLEGEEGDTGNSYASGDKLDLQLPKPQRKLMETVAASGKPVVLCLMAGSAMDLSYAEQHFGAILQLWYPGARGGKTAAEILFGQISPSGKLPVTFYDDLASLPEFTDYTMRGRTYRYLEQKPQFPFGYGLTYGKMTMENVRVEKVEKAAQEKSRSGQEINQSGTREMLSGEIVVKAEISNEGERETEDVLQIYVQALESSCASLHPSLCGFRRVHLKPGEHKSVSIAIGEHAFSVVDENGKRKIEGKRFAIYAGFSQPDERSRELTGESPLSLELEL